MGRELEEQAEMLEAVDGLADRVGDVAGGLKKMGTVIKRNEDGLSSCCIGVLILCLFCCWCWFWFCSMGRRGKALGWDGGVQRKDLAAA